MRIWNRAPLRPDAERAVAAVDAPDALEARVAVRAVQASARVVHEAAAAARFVVEASCSCSVLSRSPMCSFLSRVNSSHTCGSSILPPSAPASTIPARTAPPVEAVVTMGGCLLSSLSSRDTSRRTGSRRAHCMSAAGGLPLMDRPRSPPLSRPHPRPRAGRARVHGLRAPPRRPRWPTSSARPRRRRRRCSGCRPSSSAGMASYVKVSRAARDHTPRDRRQRQAPARARAPARRRSRAGSATRADYIYRTRDTGLLDVLFSAASFEEFVAALRPALPHRPGGRRPHRRGEAGPRRGAGAARRAQEARGRLVKLRDRCGDRARQARASQLDTQRPTSLPVGGRRGRCSQERERASRPHPRRPPARAASRSPGRATAWPSRRSRAVPAATTSCPDEPATTGDRRGADDAGVAVQRRGERDAARPPGGRWTTAS